MSRVLLNAGAVVVRGGYSILGQAAHPRRPDQQRKLQHNARRRGMDSNNINLFILVSNLEVFIIVVYSCLQLFSNAREYYTLLGRRVRLFAETESVENSEVALAVMVR